MRMVVLFTSIKKLYCFVCKLFAFDSEKIMLALVSYVDWKHAPRDLARYESSNKHLSYLLTYCISLEEQKTNRIKNRPLIFIEHQAHKKLNPSLFILHARNTITYKKSMY